MIKIYSSVQPASAETFSYMTSSSEKKLRQRLPISNQQYEATYITEGVDKCVGHEAAAHCVGLLLSGWSVTTTRGKDIVTVL